LFLLIETTAQQIQTGHFKLRRKMKTLSEVKSDVKQSMAQKTISKTKVIPPQAKRK